MDIYFFYTNKDFINPPELCDLCIPVYDGWMWMDAIIKLGCVRIFINISPIVFIRKKKSHIHLGWLEGE